jgi:hypothetical protein
MADYYVGRNDWHKTQGPGDRREQWACARHGVIPSGCYTVAAVRMAEACGSRGDPPRLMLAHKRDRSTDAPHVIGDSGLHCCGHSQRLINAAEGLTTQVRGLAGSTPLKRVRQHQRSGTDDLLWDPAPRTSDRRPGSRPNR